MILVLLSLHSRQVGSFSSSSRTPSPDSPPVTRVAIIGSGIAGLSLAHALTNSPDLAKQTPGFSMDVSLFDSRPSFDFNAGAGVQLNGGLSVLHKINPEVQRAVAAAGLPMKAIRTRTRRWNEETGYDTLLELDLEDTVRREGGRVEEELIVDGEPMFSSIMRGALQVSSHTTRSYKFPGFIFPVPATLTLAIPGTT